MRQPLENYIAEKWGVPSVSITCSTLWRDKREVTEARQVCMALTYEFTNASMNTVGDYFSGKDHSTVVHAIKQVNNLYDVDRSFRQRIDAARNACKQDDLIIPFHKNSITDDYDLLDREVEEYLNLM